MKITNVHIEPAVSEARPHRYLLAYVTLEFDRSFVVRDCRLIQPRDSSKIIVAMPDRKLGDRCPRCNYRTPYQARYCSSCGECLGQDRYQCSQCSWGQYDPNCRECRGTGLRDRHVDVCHPITSELRTEIEQAVLLEWSKHNLEKST